MSKHPKHFCTFCRRVAGIRVATLAIERGGNGWVCQPCLNKWIEERCEKRPPRVRRTA